jgi:hypothetical protein
MMRRIQFFELEDQAWLPTSIRNGITDFLQFAVVYGDIYQRFFHRLDAALQRSQTRQIIDLCSGGAGPMKSLLKHLPDFAQGRTKIHLTDAYPNLPAFVDIATIAPACITYSEEPISALNVPHELHGFRTLFSAFHHFNPSDAMQILQDAVDHQQGIAIAESTQRHPVMLAYMLVTPVLVVLTSAFQKPFRWSRLFWTYMLPVIPLAVAFDGLVSCLRTYTPEELMAMVHRVPHHDRYEWQAGVEHLGFLPIGVTYLIGLPRQA